jgi:hypothetical protein
MTEQKQVNLEERIQETVAQVFNDGTVENLIKERLTQGVDKALDHALGSYGDVTKMIEKQIKSVLVPYLESYDYSSYIVKLDDVLTEVLTHATLDNKKMLENFQTLMIPEKDMKRIKMSELFERWMKYVEGNVETDGLEVVYDDEPTYEYVGVRFEVKKEDKERWSSIQYATIIFECDHDEEMNFIVKIHQWDYDKEGWKIDYDRIPDMSSLRYINEFDVFLMKLKQQHIDLILDEEEGSEEVEPEQKPEATFE